LLNLIRANLEEHRHLAAFIDCDRSPLMRSGLRNKAACSARLDARRGGFAASGFKMLR
jgi:hypothetical protein